MSKLMLETVDSEIDVNQLMAEIRAAVAKREASGKRSLMGASVELHNILNAIIEPPPQPTVLPLLRLQPEFVPRTDDHYHVNDLLQYHDQTFIWNAYRAILKRDPDEPGLRSHLGKLRSGRFNKIDILASLRFSLEGRHRGVTIDGLKMPAVIRRLYRVPVLGYLFEMAIGIARLPNLMRSQRQFEGHLMAQQELLAARINELIEAGSRAAASFSQELSDLFEEQRNFALLQHQQVVGLFREQREIIKEWNNIRNRIDAYPGQIYEPFQYSLEPLPQTTDKEPLTAKKRHDRDELFASFAEQLRGSREDVKEGLKRYLPYINSAGIKRGILDLGSGRGEWLELLKEAGLQGRGIEINRALAEEARSSGLEVVEEDALGYLRGLPDVSLGAITGFHFIEHLSFETLIDLLDEIKRTLRPDGLVIFETPNPKNLTVAACNFYSDPTHQRPLFPETIQFILEHKGFVDVTLEYLNPVQGDAAADSDEWPETIRGLFFGPRDFAVIGQKTEGAVPGAKSTREEKKNKVERNIHQITIGDHTEPVRLNLYTSKTGHEYYARPETEDRGVFESVVDNNEYDLPTHFNESDVVIDIGAHIGGFSYAVLERGVGRVYAYEAHPVNHAIACKNLEQFGDKADCRNTAVWRSDQSTQTLYNADLTNFEHTGGISVLWNMDGIPVKSISLDEILEEASNGLKSPIRLLKLDCEGSEYPILFTAKHLWIVKEICGEYHEIEKEIIPDRAQIKNMSFPFTRHGLKDFLESSGWSVEIEPLAPDQSLGHFRARRKKRFWQLGQ